MDRGEPRQRLAQGCVIGGMLCGGAAMFTLWYVMDYWADCGSGIFAGAVVISVWPVLTLLNAVAFILALALARTMVGWAASFVAAAIVLAALTVIVTNLSFYFITPINFPPWDTDGYATSEADIIRCVAQVFNPR